MEWWGQEVYNAFEWFDREVEFLLGDKSLSDAAKREVLNIAKQIAHISNLPSVGLGVFDVQKAAGFISLYRRPAAAPF